MRRPTSASGRATAVPRATRRGLLAASLVFASALAIGTPTADPAQAAPTPVAPRFAESSPVVVIDPGHNGANGRHPKEINRLVDAGGFRKACNTVGTTSLTGMTEATFNWEVSKRLSAILSAQGWTVHLTRPNNEGWGPCVDERGLAAGRAGAVALLSIHGDGGPTNGRGFHVIWPKPLAGYTDKTSAASGELATAIRDAMVAAGFTPSTYVGRNGLDNRRDLGTLNRSPVPSMIIESGNLRNPQDDALLSSPEGQQREAQAIADGFLRWYATRKA